MATWRRPRPLPGEPRLPPGVRNGVFQKVLFDATWLAPGGTNGMGVNDLQLQGIFAVPCPTDQFAAGDYARLRRAVFAGAERPDLPPRLYESYVDFRWLSQVTPTLGLDLAITPGVFSDFDQESGKAFRLQGHGAAAWTWNETTKLVVGAAYLDRPDVEVIPIGGVIWTPNDDLKFDLIFPHPKISQRVYWGGQTGDDVQDWVYIAGEFNGDAWAIRRSDGSNDQVVHQRLPVGSRDGAQGDGRIEFAIRDRLRFRPPHQVQQRHARLPPQRHGDAARGADILNCQPPGRPVTAGIGTGRSMGMAFSA